MEISSPVTYSLIAALTATFGVIGASIYMAMRKPSPIKLAIDFNNQSEEVENDKPARKSTYADGDKFMTHLHDDALTMQQLIKRGLRESVDGKCLGRQNKETGETEWFTYEKVLERIKHVGDGLVEIGLNPGESCFGIYASNCVEYVIAEYACYNHSLIVVPLYDTLGPNACRYIINQVNITCILCDKLDRLQAIVSQANYLKNLKYIIVIDDIPESYKSRAISYGIKVFTFLEIESRGLIKPKELLSPKPQDLAVICYTSGTTDSPKGVKLTHENIISNLSSVMVQFGDHAPNKHDTYLSYLPLAHMFERCCGAAVLMVGGKIVFFNGDIKNLSDDMKAFKPTVIAVVPRILNRIYDKVNSSVKGNKVKEWLLKHALASKRAELEKYIIRNNSIWDKIVFKKIREGMGGKIRLMVCGSAPLSPNVLDFLRCAFGCVIVEGYGQTECVCPCTLTIPGEAKTGHVGPPLPSCHIKLMDIPEMNYYGKDGKGEICVKGPIVFQGYYGDAKKTASVIDENGYLHTGDIGEWDENGALRIIDRKKHIFKMSQGEYIAPEKIESIYIRSSFVAQIFIYGESLKSCLVAVIVPDIEVLTTWCRQHNITGPLIDLCCNERVKTAVLKELLSIGKKEGLQSYEQVKEIYIHPDPFTIDNGLLTPTLKVKRVEVRSYFSEKLEEMYRSLD